MYSLTGVVISIQKLKKRRTNKRSMHLKAKETTWLPGQIDEFSLRHTHTHTTQIKLKHPTENEKCCFNSENERNKNKLY